MLLFVPDVFERLRNDESFFVESLAARYAYHTQDYGFIGEISKPRLLDAHIFWTQDLDRLMHFELPKSDKVDEFKQSGHLAYWLRRVNPISRAWQGEPPIGDDEAAKQQFFIKYGAHFISFIIGFELCAYASSNAEGSPFYFSDFRIGGDYSDVVSHFLKTKDVSPHSMYLIYKALFLNPFTGDRFTAKTPTGS